MTAPTVTDLHFERDGAQYFPAAIDEEICIAIEVALAELPVDKAGVRIGSAPALREMLSADGPVGSIAATMIGPLARPVRAVLFDKTPAMNWSLGWHQDRTIVVETRTPAKGFGPWTVKAGLIQVEPPFALLERMVTLRIHLDPVDDTNAPLRVVPGSHTIGKVTEDDVLLHVARLGERICLAERGDVWLYATPILHGSRAANPPRRRRVLQVDYAREDLPVPLRWGHI